MKAVVHCLVKNICYNGDKAISLETSKGDFTLGDAKLILAMSTLPSTTLMLNSFSSPSCTLYACKNSIGKRFSAHFVSYTYARVPFTGNKLYAHVVEQPQEQEPEMAAMYIAGENDKKYQFHIQLTAVAVTKEGLVQIDTMRNLLKTPSSQKLATCEGHIVFVCASLGQLDHNNPDNHMTLIENSSHDPDITCNTMLQVLANGNDIALWDTMDESTYKVLEHLTPPEAKMQYWNKDTLQWTDERPPPKQIRSRGVVHPASTMWIGKDPDSPVDLSYRFRGVSNVYLTGGALWPTGASWNPTCVMTALAMDLADKLK